MNDPCPECGKPLPAAGQHRLCPACLMAQAIASQTVEGIHGPSAPIPEPDEIAGKFPQFEILECLGRGGMGVVYKARQKSLNRLVAIKILAPERGHDARFAERFASEAELLAKLSHPRIVTIHDFGETVGLYYLVMEFVDGVNLRDLLREGKLEPKQALAIVPEICDALQFAHDHGIIHRDIKPENILLDRLGRVKVADFGLAKLIGARNETATGIGRVGELSNLTEAGKIMGTPSYMAPEQTANPDLVDHRADIYALGVVFYRMLTGELPGKNVEAPSRKGQIDVRLDEVVMRALEKNPDLRYSQASLLKTQVETIADSPEPLNNDSEPWVQSRWSPWFGSPLQQEIWMHMSAPERRESMIRGLMFSIWNLATWFVPISIVLLSHNFARWIYATLVMGVGLACFPVWWKIFLEGQCSTAWARERGYTPDQLRKSASAISAPRWLRIGAAAALFFALFVLNFIVVPAMGWPKPNSTIVSFILSFGSVFAFVYFIQRFRRMDRPAPSAVNTPGEQSPSGGGLLALGILSLLLGPFTAIPGLFLSRRFKPFTPTAMVGYFLCWLGLAMTIALAPFLAFTQVRRQNDEAQIRAHRKESLDEKRALLDAESAKLPKPDESGPGAIAAAATQLYNGLAAAAPQLMQGLAASVPQLTSSLAVLSTIPATSANARQAHPGMGQAVVSVRSDGFLFFNGQPIVLDELAARLRGLARLDPDQAVILRFDSNLDREAHKSLVNVIELCRQANIRKIAVANPSTTQPAAFPAPATETREFEGDVGRLYHAIVYSQTSPEPPKPGPKSYQFIADMSNTQFPVTQISVSLPAGSAWPTNPIPFGGPDSLFGAHYLFAQGFRSEADLMANFPNGSYFITAQSAESGPAVYGAWVSFTGSAPYPAIAPVITNKKWDSGSLALDPASAVINYTNDPGADLTWEIFIPGRTYTMSAGGGGTSTGSLNLTGLLSYGQTYEAQLRFINRDSSYILSDQHSPKDYGYSTIMARIVEFKIRTPPLTTNNTPPSNPAPAPQVPPHIRGQARIGTASAR